MYEKTYGAKYEETKDLNRTEIAKLIRADLKEAFPGFKWAVRKSARGSSIYVAVTEAPADLVVEHEVSDHYGKNMRYTPAALEVIEKAKAIVDAYNYDGSDIQSDYFNVRFYCHPEFSYELRESRRAPAQVA